MTNQQSFHFISFCIPASTTCKRMEGFYELTRDQATSRQQIVRDIAGWQFEDMDKVYCSEPGRPLADITEEIAAEALALCVREGSGLLHEQRGWLEDILGIRAVAEACQEHPELEEV